MHNLERGMRVRHIPTGRVGTVVNIYHDNACSDPGCCGGPFPDIAEVRWDCGHYDDFLDDCKGNWAELEAIPADAPERQPKSPPLTTPKVGQRVKDLVSGLEGVIDVVDFDGEFVYVSVECGCKKRYMIDDPDGPIIYRLTTVD